jgi:hypothetical protein
MNQLHVVALNEGLQRTIVSPGRGRHRAPRDQLGRGDQKEFARVLQDCDSGQLDRKRDRTRNRAPAEVEIDEMVIRPTARDF